MVIQMDEDEQKLQDVHPDETFKSSTGKEIKNLNQLLGLLDDISPESFSHHVTDDKNDFASWIRHSVDDDELAEIVEKTTDFEQTKQVVRDRIQLLEKKIEVRQIKENLESLKSDSMGIDKAPDDMPPMEEPEESEKLDEPMGEISAVPSDEPSTDEPAAEDQPQDDVFHDSNMETPKVELQPAEPPKEFTTPDVHPFEHLKKGLHMTIRDMIVGGIIGFIIGIIFAVYVL